MGYRAFLVLSFIFLVLPLTAETQPKEGQVALPLERYNQLVEQGRDPKAPPRLAPAGYALGKASVKVQVDGGGSAKVEVTLQARVLDKDWVLVPILPAGTAVESAAENFSDGVIAPAFWYLIGGLPAMLAYKAINTADSMIGRRSERYRAFGWASARLDDLVNLIPARISALLIAAAAPAQSRALATAWRDARKHVSPNAGWPEAAMAGGLGVSLGGPRRYEGAWLDGATLYAEGWRNIDRSTIYRATRVLARAWVLCAASIVLALGLLLI